MHSRIIAWRYNAFCGGIPCMNDSNDKGDELKILYGRWWAYMNENSIERGQVVEFSKVNLVYEKSR